MSITKDRISIRTARNELERKRRDKLNGLIKRLNDLLPFANQEVSRKLDKLSTLRLTASLLRWFSNSALKSSSEEILQPKCIDVQVLNNCIEAIDGVIFIANGDFKLMYISEKCFLYLGHQNIDMIGYNMSNFIHPAEYDGFQSWMEKSKADLVKQGSSVSSRLIYRCRMREKTQPRSDSVTYQMVQISCFLSLRQGRVGNLKRVNFIKARNGHTTAKIESLNAGENLEGSLQPSSQEIIFKGVIELCKTSPLAELNLLEANLDEYVLRMSLEGVILYADHRIHLVTGYSPSEVEGKSAYEFVYPMDHSISVFAHKNMLVNSNGTGIIVHRLKTANGKLIYLQSAGCLQYDSFTCKVDHFVAVIRLMMEHEGDREREKFVRKFTPHISNVSPAWLYHSLQVVIGDKKSESSYQNSIASNENPEVSDDPIVGSAISVDSTLPQSLKENSELKLPQAIPQIIPQTNGENFTSKRDDDTPTFLVEIKGNSHSNPLLTDGSGLELSDTGWQNFSPYFLLRELQRHSSSAKYVNQASNILFDPSSTPNLPLTINMQSMLQKNCSNQPDTGAIIIHSSTPSNQTQTSEQAFNAVQPVIITTNPVSGVILNPFIVNSLKIAPASAPTIAFLPQIPHLSPPLVSFPSQTNTGYDSCLTEEMKQVDLQTMDTSDGSNSASKLVFNEPSSSFQPKPVNDSSKSTQETLLQNNMLPTNNIKAYCNTSSICTPSNQSLIPNDLNSIFFDQRSMSASSLTLEQESYDVALDDYLMDNSLLLDDLDQDINLEKFLEDDGLLRDFACSESQMQDACQLLSQISEYEQRLWLNQLQVSHRSLASKIKSQRRQLTTISKQLVYVYSSNAGWMERIPSLKKLASAQYEELLNIKRACDEIRQRPKWIHGITPYSLITSSDTVKTAVSKDLPHKDDKNRMVSRPPIPDNNEIWSSKCSNKFSPLDTSCTSFTADAPSASMTVRKQVSNSENEEGQTLESPIPSAPTLSSPNQTENFACGISHGKVAIQPVSTRMDSLFPSTAPLNPKQNHLLPNSMIYRMNKSDLIPLITSSSLTSSSSQPVVALNTASLVVSSECESSLTRTSPFRSNNKDFRSWTSTAAECFEEVSDSPSSVSNFSSGSEKAFNSYLFTSFPRNATLLNNGVWLPHQPNPIGHTSLTSGYSPMSSLSGAYHEAIPHDTSNHDIEPNLEGSYTSNNGQHTGFFGSYVPMADSVMNTNAIENKKPSYSLHSDRPYSCTYDQMRNSSTRAFNSTDCVLPDHE